MLDVGQVLVELGIEGGQLVHVGVESSRVVLAQDLERDIFSYCRARFDLEIFKYEKQLAKKRDNNHKLTYIKFLNPLLQYYQVMAIAPVKIYRTPQ